MRHLELLAPARDISIGIAAIDCGADAVYIGGPEFGARQAAGNSVEDLQKLCNYAHRFGARVFVTVNTILYDSELNEAARLLDELRRIGADAVIAQDMALLSLSGVHGTGDGSEVRTQGDRKGDERPLPLHASTQCSIRTPEKAVELEALGFSRVTLERELSLDQIRRIAAAVSCEVECFVHGAMCVCYSGQCYLSEMLAGRSANRGACVQACRSRYDVVDKTGRTIVRNKAVLSLKDLNLKLRLADLADAGVTSFKIEGRLKNISYVRNAVREYSLALDEVVAGSGGRYARASFGRVRGGFVPDVARTFNRGFTSFMIDGRPGKVAAMDAPKGMGEELGTVTAVARDFRSFRIRSRHTGNPGRSDNAAGKSPDTARKSPDTARPLSLSNGDGLAFVARNGEVVGLRADVCEGDKVRCKCTPELYDGATIYRNFDTAFEKSMLSNPCVRLLDVAVTATFTPNKAAIPSNNPQPKSSDTTYTLTVKATSEDGRRITKTYTDLWSDLATNPDRMRAMWTTQLSKTSEIYSFHTDALQSADGRLPLLSASAMNSIRTDLASELAALPCHARPMYTANPPALQQPVDSASSDENSGKKSHLHPRDLTYKDNVSNSLAEKAYHAAGFTVTEAAYELTHRPGADLMRTKYCIRRELGLCPGTDPLYLLNNGRRLTALFDCSRCEMVIKRG